MRPQRNDRPKLEGCGKCGYVACICQMLKHEKGCQRRRAVLDTRPIACKHHDSIACPDCWPCDCSLGETVPARAV